MSRIPINLRGQSQRQTSGPSEGNAPTATLLEEVAKRGRTLLTNDAVDATRREAAAPGVLRELEILGERSEVPAMKGQRLRSARMLEELTRCTRSPSRRSS